VSGDEIKSRCEKLKEQIRDASKRDEKRLGADASGARTSSEELRG